MEKSHIVTSFDEDLARIGDLILEMGGLVEGQILASVEALIKRDVEWAERIRADDKAVDALESRIDELAVRTLALRQPMAADLRSVVCALKVASNLERIGDYAKNIAKRTSVIAAASPVGTSDNTVKRMGKMVQAMVSDVLNAFVNSDLALADEVRERDEEVDQLHNTMFREMLTYMMEDPRNITPCMHLLFIAKNLERMGDHTTAVAEQVHYVITGSLPTEKRSKGDKTSQISIALEPGK
ncbi:MAG: phosphate signaling complex protein PhoU [Salaquimonas sp.]